MTESTTSPGSFVDAAITTIILWSKFPLGYNLMNLNLSYSRTSHLCRPIKFLMASLSDIVADLIPRTDLIFSILDLSRSVSGAINSSEIFPAGSMTKAAKFHQCIYISVS